MKTKVSYSHCSMFVQGLDMPCPLCKTMVLSTEPELNIREAARQYLLQNPPRWQRYQLVAEEMAAIMEDFAGHMIAEAIDAMKGA
jgi:hypothetical protein